MMLSVSGLMSSSGDGAAAPESGGASGGISEAGGASSMPAGYISEEDKARLDESDRSGGGGNRWPRQETLALLKIRSDMDVAFKDSSAKGPLWEEVSRKMAELGYQRSAKKCREKFENVYKYHKRTKEGRSTKADGKTYRFFEQLEALENNPPLPLAPPPRLQPPVNAAASPMPVNTNTPMTPTRITVPSSPNPISVSYPTSTTQGVHIPMNSPFQPSQPPDAATMNLVNQPQSHAFHGLQSGSTSSSSTSSDEDIQQRRGKKRKWKDFFEKLMNDVIKKQEELQKKFLDTLEKRERDRMAKEEAWRAQEMARMNREHDLLVQERSVAAAKDAAVIAFLQKITEHQNFAVSTNAPTQIPIQVQVPENPPPPVLPQQPQPRPPAPPQVEAPPPRPQQPQPIPTAMSTPIKIYDTPRAGNGGENFVQASSSRWPKAEVQALIDLRTSLDTKYQENGPKGPLWEEISSAMAKLGYNRSAKRCKEKWENINKYFKKVKESDKKRPEDSKTCPYFHQLDAIYKEKAKSDGPLNPVYVMNPENPMVPIMARPEQQWPLPPERQQQQLSTADDHESDNVDHNNDNEDDDGDQDDEEDEGGEYEIVTNKQTSSLPNTVE